MQIVQWIVGLLSSLAGTGTFGSAIAVVVAIAGAVMGSLSGLLLIWQGVVALLKGLGAIPGLSGLVSIANALSADEAKASSWEQSFLLPLLNQLSAIPVPTVAAAVPAVKT